MRKSVHFRETVGRSFWNHIDLGNICIRDINSTLSKLLGKKYFQEYFFSSKKTTNDSYNLYLFLKYHCYNHIYIILSSLCFPVRWRGWSISPFLSSLFKIKAKPKVKKHGLREYGWFAVILVFDNNRAQFIHNLDQNSPGFMKVPITVSKAGEISQGFIGTTNKLDQ